MGAVICTNTQCHGKVFCITSLAFEWCGSGKLQSHHVHLLWVISPFFFNVISYYIMSYRISFSSCIYNFIIVHWIPSVFLFTKSSALCWLPHICSVSYFKPSAGTLNIQVTLFAIFLSQPPRKVWGKRESLFVSVLWSVFHKGYSVTDWFCLRSQFRLWKNLLMRRWV